MDIVDFYIPIFLGSFLSTRFWIRTITNFSFEMSLATYKLMCLQGILTLVMNTWIVFQHIKNAVITNFHEINGLKGDEKGTMSSLAVGDFIHT